MRDAQELIEAMLAKRPQGFSNKHFAEALRISPSKASRILARLVSSGEVTRLGEGRGLYIRGPALDGDPCGQARGAPPRGFWWSLVEDSPQVAYVAFHRLGLDQLGTRQQVRAALRGLVDFPRSYLIADFHGVQTLSDAAAKELFIHLQRRFFNWVEPINMDPVVGRTASPYLRDAQ